MGDTTQVCFRLPTELLKQLDKYAERLAKSTGMRVTRTDALREILQKHAKKKVR